MAIYGWTVAAACDFSRAPGQAYALLIFTSLCWGGNSVLSRLAVGEVSPVAVVLLRWLGVCLILSPFVAGEAEKTRPAKRRLRIVRLACEESK